MAIPPFPSQDLAKLVLGYLAEEQLMTAYDEFLQASPYLDALGNEYDRIFMTSLKNILAEYRAVKIYVETCKPFILRKKIFQCSNLLEMVKFLIQNVDITKIQMQENSNLTQYSLEKQNSAILMKTNICDVCSSLKLDSCSCKSKNSVITLSNTHNSTCSVDNSVEATPLSELPGNHVTCRKKNGHVLNKDTTDSNTPAELNESSSILPISNELHSNLSQNCSSNIPIMRGHQDLPNIGIPEKTDSLETRQKEEFNSILNQVCYKNEYVDKNLTSKFEGIYKQSKISMAGYNDFATGVNSGNSGSSGSNVNVPDSSTSENLHIQIPPTKEPGTLINLEQSERTKVTHTKTQYLLKVANVKTNSPMHPSEVVSISTVNKGTLPRIKPKSDENKIKILSDIKVDKSFSNSEALGQNMPKVLKNATSTPLLQMQTILINGTPVYKHIPFGQKHNYSKDEIMAMPTIILAPAPDPSRIPVSHSEDLGKSQIPTTSTARHLGSLIIDVTSSTNTLRVDSPIDNCKQTIEGQNLHPVDKQKEEVKQKEKTVAKTVDITSASAPKDNTVIGTIETSTPQVIPPVRKSSSTPRRSSHVRVLDFTTPRRILHESINKCVPNMQIDCDEEVLSGKPTNISIPATIAEDLTSKQSEESNNAPLKESSKKKVIKNWDADLRALATASQKEANMNAPTTTSPKQKCKQKSTRKGKAKKNLSSKKVDKIGEDKLINKQKTLKDKSLKRKSVSEDVEIITIPDEKIEVPLKPTINIITGVDRNANTSAEANKSQNKSNNEDNNCDTPEMERISLQHEIGAKLNISDFLETPYKQVLYDIQMETPRFLGPDIPDDPMSDIKIMNIPTPRFLSAATPSSYSSRPTDYSSGGSYYKPDDQDYMRVHDELDCPVTSTKDSNKDSDGLKEKENVKPTRPVRECTKNVSYYNIANPNNRTKNVEKCDITNISLDSTGEVPTEKMIPNTPITSKLKESKSKGSSKKRKTPIKREMSKSFMKLKPRRPTPVKNTGNNKRKSIDAVTNSKVQNRKKGSSKDKSVSSTPVINSVPTKSRRKSSTPRKLHCTKSFHSESSGHDSPELSSKHKEKGPEPSFANVQDSDTEQLPLRWSDDGSQDPQPVVISIPNETEDIMKIKEYIETTVESSEQRSEKEEVCLHIDLVKRGFDLETAKIIERDLLDTPPHLRQESEAREKICISAMVDCEKITAQDSKLNNSVLDKTLESDCSTSNNLQIVQNDDEDVEEEIELSFHECNEESTNYFSFSHDLTKDTPKAEQIKLRDKFSMEVCIDDGVSIRLRATPFSLLLDQVPQSEEDLNFSSRETEMAVNSISNFEKLYTPIKESLKAQCYEIFDSTLTSLDTPLKPKSPKQTETEVSVTEIILEVEKVEEKEKSETKKRKRVHSENLSDEDETKSKKSKPETQLLFSSTNIQNFDIDSVLSKLHGP